MDERIRNILLTVALVALIVWLCTQVWGEINQTIAYNQYLSTVKCIR